jgi:uncharacterized lipoprotein YajG
MRILLFCAVSLAFLLSTCATPSQPTAMAVSGVAVASKSSETVSITVTGGRVTSSIYVSQISDADFREALRLSIVKSALFPQVVDDDSARYRLGAYIGELIQPVMGMSLTVDLEVSYTLVDSTTGKTVWQRSIASSYTATTSDSIVGATRLRLANEAAARKNIEAAVTAMGNLGLR